MKDWVVPLMVVVVVVLIVCDLVQMLDKDMCVTCPIKDLCKKSKATGHGELCDKTLW